jgi:hypothetical protein
LGVTVALATINRLNVLKAWDLHRGSL